MKGKSVIVANPLTSGAKPSKKLFVDQQQIPGLNTTNAPQWAAGKSHRRVAPMAQEGDTIIPTIAAIYAGLKAVQPFSKAKKALEENVGEKGKSSGIYKAAHKVASIGTSLGFSQPARKQRHGRK